MQIEEIVVMDIYDERYNSAKHSTTYKVKIRIVGPEIYQNVHLSVFTNQGDETIKGYALYPASYRDYYTKQWEHKWEFSKKSSFYLMLLSTVVRAVNAKFKLSLELKEDDMENLNEAVIEEQWELDTLAELAADIEN